MGSFRKDVKMGKIQASELRGKSREQIEKQVEELKQELSTLRVAKVTGGAATKLAKIKTVKKSIARCFKVMGQQQKEDLRRFYRGRKHIPKDLRPPMIRKHRLRMTSNEAKAKKKKKKKKKKYSALIPL